MSAQESLVSTLKKAIGKKVLVVLKHGQEVKGFLKGYDQHLNLHLDNAVTTDLATLETEALGTVILRGDSILFVNSSNLLE